MIRCSEHTVSPVGSQASEPTAETANAPVIAQSKYTNKQEKRKAALQSAGESGQYCIHHLTYCGCPMSNYTVVLRYSNEELEMLMTKVTTAIESR